MVKVQTHQKILSFPPIQSSQFKMDIHWFVLSNRSIEPSASLLTFRRWYWGFWCQPWGWCALCQAVVQQDCFCFSLSANLSCQSVNYIHWLPLASSSNRWPDLHLCLSLVMRAPYIIVLWVLWHSFRMRVTSPLMIKQSPFQPAIVCVVLIDAMMSSWAPPAPSALAHLSLLDMVYNCHIV